MTAYVVAISHRYKVAAHFGELTDAMAECIQKSVISFCWVVRDGATGKRYSMGDCKELLERRNVDLKISWESLFDQDKFSEEQRRMRWAAWLRLARKNGDGDMASHWIDGGETCFGCAHRRGGWCKNAGLPCTVNPILTMRHGMIGMACMGAGFAPKQLEAAL